MAIAQGATYAFAVVTGDIAFSGKAAEYAEAWPFFQQLVDVTGIEASNLYFVPGNHDVDRDLGELSYRGGRSAITSPESVDYYLAEPQRLACLIDRQAAFWSFVDDFTDGQHRLMTKDGLGYVSRLEMGSTTVCILGLNTAWLSGSNDEYGRLVVGERQLINAIDAAESFGPSFTIALAHHPLAWLTEWDADSCGTRLLPAVDFFLRGHLHLNRVSLNSSPSEPCIEIAAGSGHATRFYGNSYNHALIDLSKGTCRIQAYRYDPAVGSYEANEPLITEIDVPGSIPGNRSELAESIASSVPSAASFCGYMAGLLVNEIAEIPILVDGEVSFILPSAASQLVEQSDLESTTAFLELRNLLRLGDQGSSLHERVSQHAGPISEFASTLRAMSAKDSSCDVRLRGSREVMDQREGGTRRPWSLSILDELRNDNDWDALEEMSRRLVESKDDSIRRRARSTLVEALMHSDESQKRHEAYSLGLHLARAADAWDSEVMLASAAAEVSGYDLAAIDLVCDALRAGLHSVQLTDHARSLSTRLGSRELRDLVEEVRLDSPQGGA